MQLPNSTWCREEVVVTEGKQLNNFGQKLIFSDVEEAKKERKRCHKHKVQSAHAQLMTSASALDSVAEETTYERLECSILWVFSRSTS